MMADEEFEEELDQADVVEEILAQIAGTSNTEKLTSIHNYFYPGNPIKYEDDGIWVR